MIVLNKTKIKKNKEKIPNPTLGGRTTHFEKNKSKRQKVRKQAQVIPSLEIP